MKILLKINKIATFLIVLLCTLLVSGLAQARTKNFEILKSMLNSRNSEAKIYLPDRALLDSEVEIILDAPGVKNLILFMATKNGSSLYENLNLRLGEDKKIIAEAQEEKAHIKFKIAKAEFEKLVGENIYFDAIAQYQSENGLENRNVIFYGANAIVSNQNAVKVIAPAKSTAGAESLIRSVAPGLLNRPSQY